MSKIDQLSINTIRVLSAEVIEKANSGHPGLPLGAAPAAYTLWAKHLKHNPVDANWVDRDRFVLSAGHGSMLIYSLLHLFGYGLTIDDLKTFRQLDSLAPGHPEYKHTVGVETTTGPLGQGISNAVGMAIAERHLASVFNKDDMQIVDHYTYTLVGDGCMMEGISSEASSLAGTLALGKLIALYDDNEISIEGDTDITFKEDVGMRYKAYGWQVLHVSDGNDIAAINKAIEDAKAETNKPSMIIIKTLIGYGCPAKMGDHSAHGAPLGADNIMAMKEFLNWPCKNDFEVPKEVYSSMEILKNDGANKQIAWNMLMEQYTAKYPDDAKKFDRYYNSDLPDLVSMDQFWSLSGADATRNSSGKALNFVAELLPNMLGGSADLAPSTKSELNGKGDMNSQNYGGRNMHYGVREHAMAAIANGIALHGGLITYCATFFTFSDYMKHSMRLSAIMGLPVIYILTHDSIGVGEDGPTHQPIEQLAGLRSIPGMTVYRPADSREVAAAWSYAIKNDGPTCLVLTRQNLPLYENSGKDALKGGYVLSDCDGIPDILLLASGSEVEQIMAAKALLDLKGVNARVVSMPSFEVFDKQSVEYKQSVLPNSVRARLAVECASSFGWYKYVGLDGDVISMNGYGASAPAPLLFEKFGFTTQNVVETALKIIG